MARSGEGAAGASLRAIMLLFFDSFIASWTFFLVAGRTTAAFIPSLTDRHENRRRQQGQYHSGDQYVRYDGIHRAPPRE